MAKEGNPFFPDAKFSFFYVKVSCVGHNKQTLLDVLTIKRLNFEENFDEALFTTRFVLVTHERLS